MKHCPKCGFLYLDSDQVCDLDQTLLVTDDVGSDAAVIEAPKQDLEPLSLTAAVSQRKLNFKTVLAATVAGLVIGLMLLLSYQRMRPTLQASQAPPATHVQASQSSRAIQIAQQASSEAASQAARAQQELEAAHTADENVSPSAATSSTTTKATPATQADSRVLRVSSNPVSTGDDAKHGRGPVTIRLANGSTLQADEVWKTKAGIWYRHKGIVTFLKPSRVRAITPSTTQ